jgi:hypothetical protein
MAFTDSQVRLLKAKLDPRYIKTRHSNGGTLSYVEGWHAIAEANRIFGYEAWDRRTVSASCVWTEARPASTAPFILPRSASRFGLERSRWFGRDRAAARQAQLEQGKPMNSL